MLAWGLSRVFPKLATNHIDAKSAFFFEVSGEVLVAIIVLGAVGFRPTLHVKGSSFAMAAGILGALGVYWYLLAAERGNVSQVVMVTALYPVITVGLGFLVLGETISLREGLGMLLALVAITSGPNPLLDLDIVGGATHGHQNATESQPGETATPLPPPGYPLHIYTGHVRWFQSC